MIYDNSKWNAPSLPQQELLLIPVTSSIRLHQPIVRHTQGLLSTSPHSAESPFSIPAVSRPATNPRSPADMATSGALSIVFWVLLAFSRCLIYVHAQSIAFTNTDYTITAGSPFAISWYGNGQVGSLIVYNLLVHGYHADASSFSRLPYHS